MVGGERKADMHVDSVFSRNDPRARERGKPHCRPLVRRPVLGLAWAVSTLGSPPPPRPHCWPTSAIGGADIPGGGHAFPFFSFLWLPIGRAARGPASCSCPPAFIASISPSSLSFMIHRRGGGLHSHQVQHLIGSRRGRDRRKSNAGFIFWLEKWAIWTRFRRVMMTLRWRWRLHWHWAARVRARLQRGGEV